MELMPVRDDPECAGQGPRMASYLLAHPEVEIFWMGHAWARWQAVIREDEHDGVTVITRRRLRVLLDKLESMDSVQGCPVSPPAG